MNYVNVVTARLQKEKAIRMLKAMVGELTRLATQSHYTETRNQLDRQILRLNLYIAQLEIELDNGKEVFDKEAFDATHKQAFIVKCKTRRRIQQEREVRIIRVPQSLIVLIVATAFASAFVAGIMY